MGCPFFKSLNFISAWAVIEFKLLKNGQPISFRNHFDDTKLNDDKPNQVVDMLKAQTIHVYLL